MDKIEINDRPLHTISGDYRYTFEKEVQSSGDYIAFKFGVYPKYKSNRLGFMLVKILSGREGIWESNYNNIAHKDVLLEFVATIISSFTINLAMPDKGGKTDDTGRIFTVEFNDGKHKFPYEDYEDETVLYPEWFGNPQDAIEKYIYNGEYSEEKAVIHLLKMLEHRGSVETKYLPIYMFVEPILEKKALDICTRNHYTNTIGVGYTDGSFYKSTRIDQQGRDYINNSIQPKQPMGSVTNNIKIDNNYGNLAVNGDQIINSFNAIEYSKDIKNTIRINRGKLTDRLNSIQLPDDATQQAKNIVEGLKTDLTRTDYQSFFNRLVTAANILSAVPTARDIILGIMKMLVPGVS